MKTNVAPYPVFTPCRDESCTIVELHPEHEPPKYGRGRPPKVCPSCCRAIQVKNDKKWCGSCGWSNEGQPA